VSRRALALADDTGDFPVRVMANVVLGQAYNSLGEFRRSLEHSGANIDALVGDLASQRFGMNALPAIVARAHRARALAELGHFDEAFATAEETLRVAAGVGLPYDQIVANLSLGEVCLHHGDAPRAVAPLERAHDLERTAHLPIWIPAIDTTLGLAYALTGRSAPAVTLLEEAVEQAARMKLMFNHAARLTRLGEAYLVAGQPQRANEVAGRALGLAVEHRERGNQARALWLLGAIAATEDGLGWRAGEQQFALALDLATELEMRPLMAHCHFSLARLLRRCQQAARAGRHVAAASRLFQDMGMRAWIERAAAETRAIARVG